MIEIGEELKNIFSIPYEAALEYERRQEEMVSEVNDILSSLSSINKLIGNNPLQVMEENHENHANFMKNVFKLNQDELFLRTLPWVYRSYSARGFSYDYFPEVFSAWISAIEKYIDSEKGEYLIQVYRWLLDNHDKLIELSRSERKASFEVDEAWGDVLDKFLAALLKGDHKACLELANRNINSLEDLENFYMQVLQMAMYRIGDMWEKGEITVAHEHLSSAIVSRVMAALYTRFTLVESTGQKAVVTASPNEFHEIGARMVADFLEIDGWDVKYLGANVPETEVLEILYEDCPELLGISVAMSFNLDRSLAMIKMVKGVKKFKNLKVLVGGKVFSENPDLWKLTGADEWAGNGIDARNAARRLIKEK